jgi:tetratricopeptide (TPR) repeat protein
MADTLRTCRGYRAYGRGDFGTMAELHRQSARVRSQIGDIRGRCVQLSNLGFATMWLGNLDEAAASYEEARQVAIDLKLSTLELNAIQNLAFVNLCRGDVDAALAGSREVLKRAKIEAPRSMALAHTCIARALLARGAAEEAEADAREGVALAPTNVIKLYAHAALADVLLGARKITEARAASNEAFAVFRTMATHAVGDIYSLVVRAEVLDADDDPEGAREAIAEAHAIFEIRRGFLTTDEAREIYDTKGPDARRMLDAYARLT